MPASHRRVSNSSIRRFWTRASSFSTTSPCIGLILELYDVPAGAFLFNLL
jgi:hypothetical protein